ncbi:MAG: benzoylformate decarboxylase, partial [Acidimicrobiales bacterium]
MTATVRDVTHDLLRALGTTTVFGNPGSTELGLLDRFPADLRYVLGLHEAAAVGMADGYAQGRDGAAVVSLHSASGLGNAMGALVNAWHNRAALVVLCGQQDRRHLAIEPYLFARSAELAAPYVKWANEPSRAADVPAAIRRAHHLALIPPRGPVLVSVPAGDWDEPGPAQLPSVRAPETATAPRPAAVVELAGLIRASRRPVMVTGAGLDGRRGWRAATALAEALGCAVWAAPQAPRAGFPEDHPCFRGHLPADAAGLSSRLEGSDFVLLLGAPAFAFLTYRPGPRLPALVLVTDDPAEASRADTVLAVVADVASTVEAVLAEGGLPLSVDPPARRGELSVEPGDELTPAAVVSELAGALSPDTVLVEEVPSCRPALREHLRVRRPDSFFATASGGLGFALPASIGMKMARPERPVVALVGDGSAMYAFPAVWTAVRQGVPVRFVILDNGGYRILDELAAGAGRAGVPGTGLGGIDFVGMAASLGCPATRVERRGELAAALVGAPADRPQLVEVAMTGRRRPP